SRRELLATLRRFQPDQLTLRPGGGERTVEQIARHVATVEWWYMSRVVPFPFPKDGEYPEELEELMAWIRERVAGRLRRLSHQERAATPVPDEESGERWSARKVLRRLIYHVSCAGRSRRSRRELRARLVTQRKVHLIQYDPPGANGSWDRSTSCCPIDRRRP